MQELRVKSLEEGNPLVYANRVGQKQLEDGAAVSGDMVGSPDMFLPVDS